MIALDTNVIIRLVTADDPAQLQAALEVFRKGDLWICKTVLLETEWVLRYTYKLSRHQILRTFHRLLGLPEVQAEDRPTVLLALELFEGGFEFADALHVASCSDADHFATFDRDLAKASRTVACEGLPEVALL